jgi:predicted dehydrogenase
MYHNLILIKMKKKLNIALIGSNFALKSYLPVIKKTNQLNLKIICSRNILKIKDKIDYSRKITLETDWKVLFEKKIDLIVCAVPPLVQERILIYNLKYKKKIIFEKPISSNFLKSKYIVKKIKEKKIPCEINLTFLFHPLFIKVKNIVKNGNLGKVINYKIKWSFISYDLNKKIVSWKTNELKGGGIKNIFLTHVLSYCEFFFGTNKLIKFNFTKVKFKKLNFKNKISCELENSDLITGKVDILTKKNGHQSHYIRIVFEKGYIDLYTKSPDWTKDFVLKIVYKNSNKIKYEKTLIRQKFKDGRSNQIYYLFAKFLKKSNYNNLSYCLNAEKINKKIN